MASCVKQLNKTTTWTHVSPHNFQICVLTPNERHGLTLHFFQRQKKPRRLGFRYASGVAGCCRFLLESILSYKKSGRPYSLIFGEYFFFGTLKSMCAGWQDYFHNVPFDDTNRIYLSHLLGSVFWLPKTKL